MFQPLGEIFDQFLKGFRSTREVIALKVGMEFFKKGDMAAAISAFDDVLKKDSRNGTAYMMRAVAYISISKWTAALSDANRALELNPQLGMAHAARGKALFDLRMSRTDALAALDLAVALDKTNVFSYLLRGEVRRQIGDLDGAVGDLSKAIALNPRADILYFYRGRDYRLQRNLVKAAEDFRLAIELTPHYALAFAGFGDVLRLAGDKQLGEANIQRGAEIDRTKVAAYFYELGLAYVHLKEMTAALRYFDEAESYDFRHPTLYFARGVIRLRQEEYAAALVDLSEAVRLEPQDATYRKNRAIAYLGTDNSQGAVEDYDLLLQTEKNDKEIGKLYFLRGIVRKHQLTDDESLAAQGAADFSEAIQHGSDGAAAYYSRGYCRLNARDAVGALEDCNKAIELDPKDACAYYYRAMVYRYQRNFEQAINDSITSIELDVMQANSYLFRGIAYFRSGEQQLAKADFDKTLELDSDSYIAYAERSNLQRISGDLDAAQADIAACLKACPDTFEKYAKAAFLYHDLGDIDGAILSSERALQLQPDHADAAVVQQRITDWRNSQ